MSAKRSTVLRLCLLVLALTYGVTSGVVRRRTHDSFSQHISRVRRFPCSKPQPRAVFSEDLLAKKDVLTYQQIIPAMTVLHRCDSSSGCCMQGICTPEAESEVTLEFKIVNGLTGELKQAFVTAQNHTHCSCSEGNYLPK